MASLPIDAKTVVNVMDDEKGDVESKPKLQPPAVKTQVISIVKEIRNCDGRRCNPMVQKLSAANQMLSFKTNTILTIYMYRFLN